MRPHSFHFTHPQRFTAEKICKLYGVPPWFVDTETKVPRRFSLRRLKWWWIVRRFERKDPRNPRNAAE